MKKIRISAVVFFALFSVSCSETHPSASANNFSKELQQCMDSKMERWYKAFNHYQLEGYNMFAADLKALQEANAVYENCRAQNQSGANQETALN